MKKNSICRFLVILFFLAIFLCDPMWGKVIRKGDLPHAPPIWNGEDGITTPKLRLDECYVRDLSEGGDLPNEFIRSSKIIRIDESWWSGVRPKNAPPSWVGRGVDIRRWYFQYPEDAWQYPHLTVSGIGPKSGPASSFRPFRWAEKPEFGDKTCWIGSKSVVFAKGKVLVHIDVNSALLDREYVRRIALYIESKL